MSENVNVAEGNEYQVSSKDMDPGIRMRWVEALRSGIFRQRRSSLRGYEDDGGVSHCCLGVLCSLAEADGVVSRDEWQHQSLLPPQVARWAGLGDSSDPVIGVATDGGRGIQGSHANDSGADFNEIAAGIAANV